MKWLLILFSLVSTLCSGQNAIEITENSTYFEFHSNYWINLHHFLYQQAKGDQLKHLEQDGYLLKDLSEDSITGQLSKTEKQVLELAKKYYLDKLSEKSLLFELGELRLWLQEKPMAEEIADTTFSHAYTSLLNDFSPIYEKHFWPVHDQLNRKTLGLHINKVLAWEGKLVPRLESLAGFKWPSSPVRVDLTAYANFAGAYTQNRPTFNSFLSTSDPFSDQPEFIETVFHEGAHVLFSRDSEFRSQIYYTCQDLEMEFPRNLWHASLFYFCGRLVQEELQKEGVTYELNMNTRNIFSRYNTGEFQSILEEYLTGEMNMKTTATELLKNLKQ